MHQLTGNIIPAVVTTTAVVGGLATLELLKLVQRTASTPLFSDLTHRNHFVDLQKPSFSRTELVPAGVQPMPGYAMSGRAVPTHFSLWDKIEVHMYVLIGKLH